jgi:hypothetical protein
MWGRPPSAWGFGPQFPFVGVSTRAHSWQILVRALGMGYRGRGRLPHFTPGLRSGLKYVAARRLDFGGFQTTVLPQSWSSRTH